MNRHFANHHLVQLAASPNLIDARPVEQREAAIGDIGRLLDVQYVSHFPRWAGDSLSINHYPEFELTESTKPKSTTARKARIKSVEPTKAVQSRSKSPAIRSSAPKQSSSNLVEVVSSLVAARRHDAQALVEVGRKSREGFTAVLERQTEMVKETWSELRAVAKVARSAGVRETVTKLGPLARGSLQMSVTGLRELSGLAANAQREAFQVLARRAQENLQQLRQLRTARTAESAAK